MEKKFDDSLVGRRVRWTNTDPYTHEDRALTGTVVKADDRILATKADGNHQMNLWFVRRAGKDSQWVNHTPVME